MRRGLHRRLLPWCSPDQPPRVYGITRHLEPASAQRLQEILAGLLGETLTRREIEARWDALSPSDREMLAQLRTEIEVYWLGCEMRGDLALRLRSVGAPRGKDPPERELDRIYLLALGERLVRVVDYVKRRVHCAEPAPAAAPDARGDEASPAEQADGTRLDR